MAFKHGKHRALTRDDQRKMTEELDGDPGSEKPSLSRDTSATHYADAKKKAGRRHIIKRLLIALAVVAGAIVVAGALFVAAINDKLGSGVTSDLTDTLTQTSAPEDPFYMLLLGTDKDEERAESSDYGSSDNAYRSDSIILARIDPKDKKVTLVSIHRDTKVDLGENGTQKINAAYAIGGAAYATQVVSEFAGVPISHYAEVNMDGMAAIVDQVGGVDVNLPVAVKDPNYTGLDLPAGTQHLDGQTAALLCRARHAYDSYGDGDAYRAANQRAVIQAVAEKVLSSNLIDMMQTVQTMAGYVTCDMDVQSIVSLAAQFRGMDVNSDVMSGMEPTTSDYEHGVWYEEVDEDAWKAMMKRVDEGLSPVADEAEEQTSGVSATTADADGSNDGSDGDGSGDDGDSSSEASDPSDVTVAVENACGIAGVAGDASATLSKAGYQASAHDAHERVSTSSVVYNGDHEADAKQVASSLAGSLDVSENDGSWPDGYDVIVVLGTDWSE